MSRDELLTLAEQSTAANSRTEADLLRAKRENRRLEAICEKQAEQLEDLKRAKFAFSKQRPGKPG